jgi:hypothetical protein
MSTSPKSPTRFGYKVALITALAFGGVASWPYLSRAAEKAAKGEAVSAAEVKKEVEKEEKEKEKKDDKNKPFEPKSVLAIKGNNLLVGGKGGLKELKDGKLEAVAGFEGGEVRGIASTKDGSLFAAAKDGLWKRTGGSWKNVREGDYWGISEDAEGVLYVAGKTGVFRSADGAQWEPVKGTETGWKPGEEHEKKEKGEKPKDYKG